MKWRNFLLGAFLLGTTDVLASEGEETKEAVAEGSAEAPAKDVATEETDDHENEDDIGEFHESLTISSTSFDRS